MPGTDAYQHESLRYQCDIFQQTMLNIFRTPDERFHNLPGYPYGPHFLDWRGLRMHYVDEGAGAPVLMLHGEPTWSYLYRKMIPPLVAAGVRCIAPDYIGFGKSDKVTDDSWYVIERHMESIRALIGTLDLWDITIVAQDWGGPIGLRQAVDLPECFARLVILNTWLHQEGYRPSEGLELESVRAQPAGHTVREDRRPQSTHLWPRSGCHSGGV